MLDKYSYNNAPTINRLKFYWKIPRREIVASCRFWNVDKAMSLCLMLTRTRGPCRWASFTQSDHNLHKWYKNTQISLLITTLVVLNVWKNCPRFRPSKFLKLLRRSIIDDAVARWHSASNVSDDDDTIPSRYSHHTIESIDRIILKSVCLKSINYFVGKYIFAKSLITVPMGVIFMLPMWFPYQWNSIFIVARRAREGISKQSWKY